MRLCIAQCALCISLAGSAQSIDIDASRRVTDISPAMYGVFFEDINFAADGGLYAELVKNRSFDFPQGLAGWTAFGDVTLRTDSPAYPRNPRYAHLVASQERMGTGLENEGFRFGMGLHEGEEYHLAVTVRSQQGAFIMAELIGSDGATLDTCSIAIDASAWHKVTRTMRSPVTDGRAHLRLTLHEGAADIDHVSLFPVNTWRGRENGLRRDLAEALRDLAPGVLRFPGGCIVEGTTLATRYQWKNTVGPVENRPLNENRWNYNFPDRLSPDYFQSYGLGFYEYFQLAEDLGAEPLPVISCGMACQFTGDETAPLDSLQPFIDDVLDLIEFANGPVTTKWGKVRADMGHAAPFNLHMVAVGNEQWGEGFVKRLEPFVKAIRKRYPQMKIIGSAGPYAGGELLEYLWPEMRRLGADLVDEHYYMAPQWFLSNAHRYDNYSRKGPKVFAGEYAAHDYAEHEGNTWLSALSEAAFMTGLERNADVVRLATYAPLFAHKDAWQWRPDLIWFDNLSACRTPNYYVQQLYSMNRGTHTLALTTTALPDSIYATAATDATTGEIIVKLVNATDTVQSVTLNIKGATPCGGTVTTLQCDDLTATNSIEMERIAPRTRPLAPTKWGETLPARSFSVYRIRQTPAKKNR